MSQPQISLMRSGFAVIADEDIGSRRVEAVFNGWVEANNYLHRNVGANRGKVVEVKELQGKMEG